MPSNKSLALSTIGNIQQLLSNTVRGQMLEDIASNCEGEVLWWGKLKIDEATGEAPVEFVEAAACGNEDSVLAHFPYMERGDVVLHNHPSGDTRPSNADIQVASELAMQGIGFYIVDNRLTRICVVAKAVRETEPQLLDLDELSALISPTGPLANNLTNNSVDSAGIAGIEYEERPEQQAMLRLIGSAFNDSKIVVAEGGTGIGKSFAYLLPAAFWALHNKRRVIISTATINLQQQLIEKDIPLICKITGLEDLKAELVKGRNNYLCWWRLKQTQEEALYLGFNDADDYQNQTFTTELASIEDWAKITPNGSRSDLGFQPQSGIWHQVCGESDNCLGLRCEFYERCFIILARRRAAAAHILIVNHHLLFADLELRKSGELGYEKTAVLPPYAHVIVDEAHNIERSAQSFFSQSISRFQAHSILRRLHYKRGNRERGLWPQLRPYAELEVDGGLPDILEHSQNLEDALMALDNKAKIVLESAQLGRQQSSLRIPKQWDSLPMSVQQTLTEQLWPQLQHLQTRLNSLLWALQQIYELLENVLESEEQKLLFEWRQLSRRLESLKDIVQHWLSWKETKEPKGSKEPSENTEHTDTDKVEVERVFWLEKRNARGTDYHRLLSTQINIGDLLHHVLYQPMRSIVMVSATLTVRGQFNYWFSRVGLAQKWKHYSIPPAEDGYNYESNQYNDQEQEQESENNIKESGLRCAIFTSPFDYQNRVHLLLASDAPEPNRIQEYNSYIAHFAHQALQSMKGRSLLLFTAYHSLNQCYDSLRERGEQNLLRQGEDDSARLLQKFKAEEHLSLLATDSFWEGVDAPGATLTQVLLCRLPFRSPEDPIVAAHTEYLERQGENAFFHYSLPEAILRFRQGFGRLMRRASDHGLVIVLDPRIVQKSYGKDFLKSLPPVPIVRGDLNYLQKYIQNYTERLF